MVTSPSLISWPWTSNSHLMWAGNHIPPFTPSYHPLKQSYSLLVLSYDLPYHITDKTETAAKELLRPSSHCQHLHTLPSHLLSQINCSWFCCAHGSHFSHQSSHHEFFPLPNATYLLEICYFAKKLSWPRFSPGGCPSSSLPFTAKLLLKSCLYSQYPIHMLPFCLRHTLIRVSSPPLHQSCPSQNHHRSPLY